MTTRLEVINHMLNVIGENAVSSAASTHPSVLSAQVEINRVSKELQARGYWFNTDYAISLQPNESGSIVIPAGTLSIKPEGRFAHLARRGGRLYDPVKHTFNINEEVKADVILLLEIEDLPEVAAIYLMHQAAHDFYVGDDGDEYKTNVLAANVAKSWALLLSEKLKQDRTNAKRTPAGVQLRVGMIQQGSSYNPNYPGGRP